MGGTRALLWGDIIAGKVIGALAVLLISQSLIEIHCIVVTTI